ncbi:mandelate racemase/muconate lactonizing enzyme family protein [Rugosimonospora africana]|uniref:D-galactarolactone cycloisomerase n=1 Tax=Rugosimonospora africana TaxID=556532 RepID=A0A8J3VTR2_9ACTN|nr:mandelate racemase/muconate lactonizing enzyme family protein [Rugosimonospora africana]GIH17803.1 D-galactarolactone cycloisomerase [Rugosimonospora africana]
MKIAHVRARLLEATPEVGVTFGIGAFTTFSMVLVEITTDDGLVGYGEAIARRGGMMTAAAVESLLADVLVGEDPANVEGLWVRMVDRLRRWGHSGGVVIEAISGVDVALWDLIGKAYGLPVWRLLAGAGRTEVPCYASSVYINEIDVMVAEALDQQRRGFSELKVKIGRPEHEGGQRRDLEALAAIREAVGDSMALYVDANGAYDAAGAIRMGRAMEALGIRWFEEPVPPDDLAGYERVHAMTSTPLARGETDFGLFSMRDVIERRLVDVVQPDLARCGGITAARHVWTLTYGANLAFAPHTGFSGGLSHLAALHVAAAAPNLLSLEYMYIDNPLREIFVGGYPMARDGRVTVPDGPGLGLDIDRDKVAAYAVG